MIILDRLPVFIAVAEELSFSRAAEKLGRTQSAVSQSVAQLEEELDCELFFREARKIRLTEPGKIMLEQSYASLAHVETALHRIREWKGLKRGQLRIGSSHTTAYYLLPPVLELYHQKYPEIDVVITEILSGETPRSLKNGTIDLGIGIIPSESDSLTLVPLIDREDVIISRDPIKPAGDDPYLEKTLKGMPFVYFSWGMQSRKSLYSLISHWETPPRVVMESNNIEVIKKMVAAGLGVTLLPRLTVQEEITSSAIHALPVDNVQKVNQVGLMFPEESGTLPAVRAFRDLIVEYYQ